VIKPGALSGSGAARAGRQSENRCTVFLLDRLVRNAYKLELRGNSAAQRETGRQLGLALTHPGDLRRAVLDLLLQLEA
jgi:hypothetical protein